MTPAAERILDLALQEVLGGKRPPDLTLRILSAARAEDEGAARPRAPRRRVAWWVAAVAAVVLLGVGGWHFLQPRDAEPPAVVATSSIELLALVDGQEQPLDSFAPGDTVIVPGPEDATLTLATGQTLTLQAPAALRFSAAGESEAFRVLAGAVRVTNGGGKPLALTAPQCEVVLDPDATSFVDVLVDPWRTPEAFVRAIRAGTSEADYARHTVLCAVEEGQAAFVRLKTKIVLKAGEFVTLWPDAELELADLPTLRQRFLMAAFLAKARSSTADVAGEAPDRMAASKSAQAAALGLTRWLPGQPDAWPWLRPYVHRLPLDPKRNDAKRRLLQLLLGDSHQRTRDVFLAVLAADPGVLDLQSTLMLAEGGLAAAEERLRAILAEPGAAQRPDNVYPALYFSMRGDNVGRAALEATMANEGLLGWNRFAWYAAVAGLELLGDPAAWDAMITRLEARVNAADESQLPMLSLHVLAASYFHRLVGAGRLQPVSHTRNRVQDYQRRNAQRADTLAKNRSLLESLHDTGR